MKTTYGFAVLALVTAAIAVPADQLEKRATCTIFGFTYPCASTGTTLPTLPTTIATTTTPTAKTTAAAAPTATSGDSSTDGASTYTSGDTANDVTDNNGCSPLTVIFARGTSESGNIGTVAGPPMFEQLIDDLGAKGVSLQGVPYPASVAGNADCGSDGGSDMASLVSQALSQCPNTKIALSGYSQGACVVHNAVQQSGVSASSVGAVVLFGKCARLKLCLPYTTTDP